MKLLLAENQETILLHEQSPYTVLVGKKEQGMKTFSQNTLVPLITYFSDGWEADKEFLLHKLF